MAIELAVVVVCRIFCQMYNAGFFPIAPRVPTALGGWRRRYQDASNACMRLATIPEYPRIPVVLLYLTVRLTLNAAHTDEPLTYFCQGFPIEGR